MSGPVKKTSRELNKTRQLKGLWDQVSANQLNKNRISMDKDVIESVPVWCFHVNCNRKRLMYTAKQNSLLMSFNMAYFERRILLLYKMSDIYVSVVDDRNTHIISYRRLCFSSIVECMNVKISLRMKQAGTDVSTWHFVTLLLVM